MQSFVRPSCRPSMTPSEQKIEYENMFGINVCSESKEIYSTREIQERASLAKKWFAKNALMNLNRKMSSSQGFPRKRFSPY